MGARGERPPLPFPTGLPAIGTRSEARGQRRSLTVYMATPPGQKSSENGGECVWRARPSYGEL